jgi:hypothetical protein
MMTPAIEAALSQLRAAFPEAVVSATEDGSGGAFVEVSSLQLGSSFTPGESWIGFHLTYQYPEVDVYPHFMDQAVRRTDGQSLGEGLGQGTWRGRPAIQISRRTANWNQVRHNVVNKLHKVLAWLKSK